MNIIRPFLRLVEPLSLYSSQRVSGLHTSGSLGFWLSPSLFGEPLKKKRKLDPAIVRARDDRKKKRLEKTIRQLQKNALTLKPIDELLVSKKLLQQATAERARKQTPLPEEEVERRAILGKTWSRYKNYQALAERDKISDMVLSQENALMELRKESEDLYKMAVSLDGILPFSRTGPSATPPIADYQPPDGDYQDTTRKW